ncbi:hypothetical protein N7451_008956 [Penicillium sp. IBT 35674x]|nr:hypothetical protein N7451_008956 [Penicillium sp. IBT 35674x]
MPSLHTHEKYVFGRDSKESDRLNDQHRLLTKVTENTLIHPSIPKGNLLSVADIATGTGIWLKDVSKVLGPGSQSPVYYHGFDISSQQFPKTQENIQFSIHDITKPFPAEHLGRYDLVHVRLLVAAIDESDYKLAIANIDAILKPGGYLQWEEIDEETYISDNNPVIQEIRRCFDSSFTAEGKCFQASAKVFQECMAAGFLDVVRLAYTSDWDRSIRHETDERLVAIIETLYAGLLVRSGQVKDEEAAIARTADLVKQHREICATGNSPPLKLMRVVAQKPN